MSETIDPTDALRRIAALANEAAARRDVPDALKPILDEIRQLAGRRGGDTPDPSDLPRTENQSL